MTYCQLTLLALLASGCTLVNSRAGLTDEQGPSGDGDGPIVDGDPANASDGGASSDGDGLSGGGGDGDGDGDGTSNDGGAALPDAGVNDPDPDGGEELGPQVVQDELIEPRGIALRTGQVCWVGGSQPKGLYCAARNGSGDVEDVDRSDDRAALDDAFDLSFDDTFVYWSNGSNNQVIRRALSGGSPEEYFTGAQGFSYLAQEGATLFAITQHYANQREQASVVFGPFSGPMSQIIYPEEHYAAGVAIVNNVVYWGTSSPDQLAFGPDEGNAEVIRVNAQGGVSGVAVDSREVAYFIAGDQRIYRLRPGSLTPDLVYEADQPFGQSDITLDDTHIYWTEHDRGRVMRMKR